MGIDADPESVPMRAKPFFARVADPNGAVSVYRFDARTRRGARRQAREWVARRDCAATFVGIEPDWTRRARNRRLLAFAGVTFVVASITITGLMIIGLTLEGAL
jgi:hypothetical protein